MKSSSFLRYLFIPFLIQDRQVYIQDRQIAIYKFKLWRLMFNNACHVLKYAKTELTSVLNRKSNLFDLE